MKYSLAIEWKPNNYLPIEWNLLSNYNGAPVDELAGIDSFTLGMTEEQFRLILDTEFCFEPDKKIVIYFIENGFKRQLPYGPCFSDKKPYLDKEFIYNYLLSNAKEKTILNKIFNACNKFSDKTPAFHDLLSAINNLKPENINALNNIHYIDYIELRSLGMFITTLISPIKSIDNDLSKAQPITLYSRKKELTKEAA